MKYLPTGCPNNDRDPHRRKRKMEDCRLALWDGILAKLDQVSTLDYEIYLCDMRIKKMNECEKLGIAVSGEQP